MARYKGPFDFDGSVGDLTFYTMKGKKYVKTKSEVSKKKIKTSPSSQGTRDMNMEFGGASKAATAIRRTLYAMVAVFGESYISGALSGRVHTMILLGMGARGQRAVDFRQHGSSLAGFEFDREKPLGYSMNLDLVQVQLNAARDLVTWELPAFEPQGLVSVPTGATHLRFVLAAGQVSNYYYNPTKKGYAPALSIDKRGVHLYSDPQDVRAAVIGPLHLELPVPGILPTPEEVAVVMCAGIQFCELVNGAYYLLKEKAALQIVGVG